MKKDKYVVCPICGTTYNVTDDDCICYSICPNCYWEYDIHCISDTDYSSANKMTIKEAKEKLN